MHDVLFAGQRFLALPERALFWPDRRALLVADLHLEKASWFARGGQMLPPFDSQATLERLIALAERLDAAEVWALGDSFHDDAGPERLDSTALQLADRLAQGRRLVWIAGNHDRTGRLPGDACEEAQIAGLVLRHEAQSAEQRFEISGHYHPKLRVQTVARSVSRPCFAVGQTRIILPAFGALTGGLDVHTPALLSLLGSQPQAWIATAQGVHRYPLTALSMAKADKRAAVARR